MRIFLYIFLLFLPLIGFSQELDELGQKFPVPNVKHQLFYLQRNKNINTVIYTLNLDKHGELNQEKSIYVYWEKYHDKLGKKELTYIEKKFAFEVKNVEESNPIQAHFVSYKRRKLTLVKDKSNHYKALIKINGKEAYLDRIYIQADNTSFWPKIAYVNIYGTDPTTGEAVLEHFDPNKK